MDTVAQTPPLRIARFGVFDEKIDAEIGIIETIKPISRTWIARVTTLRVLVLGVMSKIVDATSPEIPKAIEGFPRNHGALSRNERQVTSKNKRLLIRTL